MLPLLKVSGKSGADSSPALPRPPGSQPRPPGSQPRPPGSQPRRRPRQKRRLRPAAQEPPVVLNFTLKMADPTFAGTSNSIPLRSLRERLGECDGASPPPGETGTLIGSGIDVAPGTSRVAWLGNFSVGSLPRPAGSVIPLISLEHLRAGAREIRGPGHEGETIGQCCQ